MIPVHSFAAGATSTRWFVGIPLRRESLLALHQAEPTKRVALPKDIPAFETKHLDGQEFAPWQSVATWEDTLLSHCNPLTIRRVRAALLNPLPFCGDISFKQRQGAYRDSPARRSGSLTYPNVLLVWRKESPTLFRIDRIRGRRDTNRPLRLYRIALKPHGRESRRSRARRVGQTRSGD